MEKKFIQLLIKLSQKVAIAKVKLGAMADKYPNEYIELRSSLNEIVDEMAKFCNCSPTKLIFGKIDELCDSNTP
jgi:hypothetical protein